MVNYIYLTVIIVHYVYLIVIYSCSL